MTENERDRKFYQIADKSHEWLMIWETIEFDGRPAFAAKRREELKPLEADILRLADEIRSADLAEAHRDACEDWS